MFVVWLYRRRACSERRTRPWAGLHRCKSCAAASLDGSRERCDLCSLCGRSEACFARALRQPSRGRVAHTGRPKSCALYPGMREDRFFGIRSSNTGPCTEFPGICSALTSVVFFRVAPCVFRLLCDGTPALGWSSAWSVSFFSCGAAFLATTSRLDSPFLLAIFPRRSSWDPSPWYCTPALGTARCCTLATLASSLLS